MKEIKHHYGKYLTRRKRYRRDKELGLLKQPKDYISNVTPLDRSIGLKILELARL